MWGWVGTLAVAFRNHEGLIFRNHEGLIPTKSLTLPTKSLDNPPKSGYSIHNIATYLTLIRRSRRNTPLEMEDQPGCKSSSEQMR